MCEDLAAHRHSPEGECLIARLEAAQTPWARLIGLLGRTGLPPGHGLLLDPCASIHTFGMLFSIDTIFLDRKGRVVRLHRNVGPFRIVFGGRTATQVIEIQSGWMPPGAVAVGDLLCVVKQGEPSS